jgi:hypothetical protein
MNPLVGMAMCLQAFSVGMCMRGICIFFCICIRVVTLTNTWRAPPNLDDGLPSETVSHEDGGGCSEPQ